MLRAPSTAIGPVLADEMLVTVPVESIRLIPDPVLR